MKPIAPAALDAIEAGDVIVSGAVAVLCDPPVRVWGGHGVIEIDGEEFEGVGDRGLAQVSAGALGSSAQGLELKLSGVDAETLALLDASSVRAAPVILWRQIFDGSGTTLLDAQVYTRGRVDELPTEEQMGGEAVITAKVESAARGLGRRGGRLRSDADQRLVDAADGGLSRVSFAGQKTLYWGGKPPSNASVATGGMRRVDWFN